MRINFNKGTRTLSSFGNFFLQQLKSIMIKTCRLTASDSLEKLKPTLFIQRLYSNLFNVNNAKNNVKRKEVESSDVSNAHLLIYL